MCKFRDFEKYEIYEDGRIWSYSHKKFLKPFTMKNGYQLVRLSDNEGNIKTYQLHRVVYEAIIGEPIPEWIDVNHIDECKTNNNFNNLNLMTRKENCNFGTRNARIIKSLTNNQKLSKALTNNPKLSKAVGAYKNGNLVMSFPSIAEAQRQGFDCSHISACCNGKLKTHKGYTWKYI